jgi:superfamily II DNA or RNA helicase
MFVLKQNGMKERLLYDYQLDMKRRVGEAFGAHRSVMVQMPTGTGKTCLLVACVRAWLSQNEGTVWIVVHRRELVEQIVGTLQEEELVGDRVRVFSIQWLSRHEGELAERPGLLVIDEAHHAVAKTYKAVVEAFSGAKVLGLTATPCRLTRRGFTDLFEVLLQSWPYNRFIAEGRLSLYDYMSVRADNEDWRVVRSLERRGADGDFSLREMSERLDVRPSIGRLCDTVLRYAREKKGIVYAIDIRHAEHIAAYYREHGIDAVAISAKTPGEERRRLIEQFKAGETQVLVNVDIFGEGFDCPDVEFIQLARPTLSLAKYLQQVGRGMRVFDGKRYCLILDNVGLYRLFGLPSEDRDWQAMFEGTLAGKAHLKQAEERSVYAAFSVLGDTGRTVTADARTELVTVMTHDGQRNELEAAYAYRVVRNEAGRMGVATLEGEEVLPPRYEKVELLPYGFARLTSRRKVDRDRPWMDLCNGLRFAVMPTVRRCGFLSFSTADGLRLYPRVETRRLRESDFVTPGALHHGLADGLRFRDYYIPPTERTPRIYVVKDQMDDRVLLEAEDGTLCLRIGWGVRLEAITLAAWKKEKELWRRTLRSFDRQAKLCADRRMFPYTVRAEVTSGYHLSDYKEVSDVRITRSGKQGYNAFVYDVMAQRWKPVGSYREIFPPAYGLRVVRNWEGRYLLRTQYFEKIGDGEEPQFDYAELQDDAYLYIYKEKERAYYVDLESGVCFDSKPQLVRIGFMQFQKDGDLYFPFDPRLSGRTPNRRGEIVGGEDICFLGSHIVVLKDNPSVFYIRKRYSDGKRFVLSTSQTSRPNEPLYDLYYNGRVEMRKR